MADLSDDFQLLIRKSCEEGLEQCQALPNLPQLAPLLAEQTPSAQFQVLKKFLLEAVHHSAERAAPQESFDTGGVPQERDVIRAAAACIGLEPWQGGLLELRSAKAAVILGRKQSTVRRQDWRQKFIKKLVGAVYDFLDDDDAIAKFVKAHRPIRQPVSDSESRVLSAVTELQPSALQPGYVHRPELEARFRQLVDDGAKLIVFSGLPGMGKTWLAQELSMQTHPDHVQAPLIRIVRGQIEITDLQAALVTSAIESRQAIADDPREYLAMLLCDDHAPLFTILDGVESADELHTLLPAGGARHVVLATCRDRGKAPPEHCRFLKVSEMEPEEAAKMAHKRLPALTEADTNQLASTLNCYPLVIRYACALIDQQRIPVAQFCHDLDVNPGIAGQIYADHDTTLLAVLQRMVSAIEAIDKGALKLLMVIASCNMRSAMDRNILWRYASACYNQNQPLAPTRFAQSMDLLERFSLIESKIISGYSPSEDVAMHQLTKRLLKQEVVGDELGVIALDFTYLSMTYTLETGMSRELRLLPGDVAAETVMTHLIMIVLCGEVIINNHPPGAIAKIAPEVRPGVESYLAFLILRANDGLGKAGLNWRLPLRWVEWAKTCMREHGKLARLVGTVG
jgi:hypothetical protein